METKPQHCRRRFRRYIVSGEVKLIQGRRQGTAQLVQFGLGGMLLRGGMVLPVGSRALARIAPGKYPYEIESPIEVVGTRNALMAVKFAGLSPSIADFAQWLSRANYPTAPEPGRSGTAAPARAPRCSTSIPRWSRPKDREAALEFILL
jgi:hypothetical protein